MSILSGGINVGGGGGGGNGADLSAVNRAIASLTSQVTTLGASQDQNAENIVSALNSLESLNNLTHELSVEYDFNWENDNNLLLAFTRTEPTPSNIEGLTYQAVHTFSSLQRFQYIVMRVPRNLSDPTLVHNYRIRGARDENERIIPHNQLTGIHFTDNFAYYGFTQIPGSGALSQTDVFGGWTWRGQRDVAVQRNTLFSGDLAYDDRNPSEQHFAVASASTVADANSVGNKWYARRIIFNPTVNKIIETRNGGDIDFLGFLLDHQVNAITDPDQLWNNESATYSNHFFNFRQTGLYKMRLILDHLSSDERGIVVRFFRWVREVETDSTDEKVSDFAFTSVATQNLPKGVLGGSQVASAYPNVMEIGPFRIDTIGMGADHFYFALFERLQSVAQQDTFTGRLEVLRLGD